jgi:hypothetical protein
LPYVPPALDLDPDAHGPIPQVIAKAPLPKTRPADAPPRSSDIPTVVARPDLPPVPPALDLDPDARAPVPPQVIARVPLPKTRPADATPPAVEHEPTPTAAQPTPAPPPADIIVEEKRAAEPPRAIASVPIPKTRPSDAPRPVETPPDVAAQPSPPPAPQIVEEKPPVELPRAIASVPIPKTRPSDAPRPVETPPDVTAQPSPSPAPQIAEEKPAAPAAPVIAAIPLPRERPAEQAPRPGARFTLGALRKLYENELREQREQRERFELPQRDAAPAPAKPEAGDLEQPVPPAAAETVPPPAEPAPTENTVTAAVMPETVVTPSLPMPVILRIPTPKKRPNDAMPRLFEGVFRELRVKSPGTECSTLMSSGIIVAERLPGIGRGACHLPDAVKISAIVMPDRRKIEFVPAATMRCRMALEIINWVRGDVAVAAAVLDRPIVGIRNYDSYNCRSMSSSRKMLSEHGKGNALDINSFLLAGGQKVELTDRRAHKNFRHKLRLTACKRFKTVLGPGVPQHHDHIHVDLRKHYGAGGICHWNVH